MLQNIFYATTIIMEFLAIVLLALLVICVFYIMRKIGQLSDNLNRKIDAAGHIVENPGEVAAEVGGALAAQAVNQVKEIWNNRK